MSNIFPSSHAAMNLKYRLLTDDVGCEGKIGEIIHCEQGVYNDCRHLNDNQNNYNFSSSRLSRRLQ